MFIQYVAVNKSSSFLTAVLACLLLLAVPDYACAFDSVALQQGAVVLTPAEHAYLKEHKKVTLCVDPDWVPYERIDATGKHVGIAADLLALVEARTGIEFQLVPTRDWNESLEFSKSGKCQALSFLNQSVERSEWLIFTSPLFSDPNVFITREEHPLFLTLPRLKTSPSSFLREPPWRVWSESAIQTLKSSLRSQRMKPSIWFRLGAVP